jgi:hypothetical protein
MVRATLESAPNNAVIVVSRYSGVAASGVIGAAVSANTNGAGGSCSGGVDDDTYAVDLTTTAEGSVIYCAATMRTKSHAPGAGFVERAEEVAGSGGSAASAAIMDQTVAAPSTVTVSGSFSGTVDWAVVALEIRAGVLASAHGGKLHPDWDPDDRGGDGGEQDAATAGGGMAGGHEPDAWAGAALPKTVSLRGYPNPFRSEATIECALPAASAVSIVIYDAAGRVVRRLTDGVLPPGVRMLRWDARNDSGSPVSPGVYFVRMEVPDRALMKKLVLRR